MQRIYAIAALYLKEFLALEEKQEQYLLDHEISVYSEVEAGEDQRPYQVLNGTALYDISGKMVTKGNFFTQMFGITSYDQIAEDFSAMHQDAEVERILISMNTPGGNVAGISDLSDTWKRLNAEKSITVHTAGMLASAGVWLASNSDKIYASEVSDVGSIGVVLQHVSYQGQLAKEGIKVTEIKSSPLKHIGSPAKDLTEAEEGHLQKKVDESDALFQKQMYTSRPQISPDAFTGETFSATESLRLGLIDGISTYTQAFEQLSASANSDNINSFNKENSMKRKVTAAMAEAAIASGASPENLEILTQEEFDALQPDVVEGVEETAEVAEEGQEAVEADEETAEQSGEEVFQAQVEGLQTELSAAVAQAETLEEKVTSLETQLAEVAVDPLRVIAEERISVMRVALGLTQIDMSAFATNSILAEYKALDEQFKKAFKPGGHTKQGEAEKPKPKATVTNIDKAHLRAVGI